MTKDSFSPAEKLAEKIEANSGRILLLDGEFRINHRPTGTKGNVSYRHHFGVYRSVKVSDGREYELFDEKNPLMRYEELRVALIAYLMGKGDPAPHATVEQILK